MNIAHLRTLLAIRQTGSLSQAAATIHLSHSALSVQMKQLEAELGAPLLVPGRRPATLTRLGREVAAEAEQIVARVDALAGLGAPESTTGTVSLGFVPTTLQTLLPVALETLRARFPDLTVKVRSGLSARLAEEVATGRLDFAFLTAPVTPQPTLALHEIGTEPLILISAQALTGDIRDILAAQPFIAFSRDTWLGGQIAQYLQSTKGLGEPAIELDSIDAIEHLVALGLGVSVVPRRLLAPPLARGLFARQLGAPAPIRRLMLASAGANRRRTIHEALAGLANL